MNLCGFSPVGTSKDGVGAEIFFDSENLVVLGESLGSARSASLDLASLETDDQIGDEGVFSFARSVGDHDAPAGIHRHLSGLDGLGEGTNLVHLQQESVAGLLVQSGLDSSGVGDQEIVSNNLGVLANSLGESDVA